MANAKENGISEIIRSLCSLDFLKTVSQGLVEGVRQVADLQDPPAAAPWLYESDGLKIVQKRSYGVIAMIFESRPNVSTMPLALPLNQ